MKGKIIGYLVEYVRDYMHILLSVGKPPHGPAWTDNGHSYNVRSLLPNTSTEVCGLLDKAQLATTHLGERG